MLVSHPHRLPDHLVAKHEAIGARLKWARARAQLTVRSLADVAGVAFSAVSEIEKGERKPRADTLERLAVALKVPVCWLGFGEGPTPEGWAQDGEPAKQGESKAPSPS